MISFRFHIVSIVAVFLALAIGIVVGSTVIDQTIVDTLQNRVEDVKSNLDDRQRANDELSSQVDDLEAYAEDSAAITVTQRMVDSFTVIVTDQGVDRDPVDRTIELLDEAGASVRGVLTLDASWELTDADQRAALAEVVDLDADEPIETLQGRAASLLVTDLSSSVEVVDDGTGALDEIAELGMVDFEVIDNVVVPRPNQVLFLVVSGPDSDLTDPAHTTPFAFSAVQAAGGAVLAEVYQEHQDGPDRADSLAGILGDPDLSAQITTVDDLDLVFGPTTAVLALFTTQAGEIGHYGVGDGADAAAPPPPDAS